jgi:biopolymer transport protein ExbD
MALQRQLDTVRPEPRTVFVEADRSLPYEEVERMMGACREAGAEHVALLAERKLGQ